MTDLPSGTVTFLFTDIEGSTRRWEEDPAGMRRAVDRHLELLRQAVVEAGGHPFKVVGDALQAAFHTPAGSTSAASWAVASLSSTCPPCAAAIMRARRFRQGAR